MLTIGRTLAIALALILAPSAIALAQTAPAATPPAQAQAGAWYAKLFAPDLIGKPLRNGAGDQLGKIEEVARDAASGDLVAVVQSGGFFGFGGNHKVVPLSEVKQEGGNFIVPQGSKDKLAGRPDFNEAKYPPVTHFSALGTVK